MRRLAPQLLRAVGEAQRLAATWHQEIAPLDAAVGGGAGGYFEHLVGCPPLMAGQVLDAWAVYVTRALALEDPPR